METKDAYILNNACVKLQLMANKYMRSWDYCLKIYAPCFSLVLYSSSWMQFQRQAEAMLTFLSIPMPMETPDMSTWSNTTASTKERVRNDKCKGW